MHISFRILIFSECMPRNGVATLYDNSIFSCLFVFFSLGTSILFSKVAAQIYIPSSSVGGFLFLQNSLFVDFLLMAVLLVRDDISLYF